MGHTPAAHLHSSLSYHLHESFELHQDCAPDVGAKRYYRHLTAAICKSVGPLYLGARKKNNKTFFFPQMFFIAQIQVAQQYSTLTAQNNSVTGTRRHRSSVCVYENWIQCPTSKHSDYFEVLRTFLDCGKCCNEGKGIHVVTRSSAIRSPVHTGSPTTVSCNTL